jgi:Na+/proline symporter
MELIVLGLLCESLLDLDYRWGVGLGGFILSLYSAHGGIKAVTATDVFQFLVLLIVLPIIAVWALDHAGGIQAVFDQVPVTKMQITNHPNALYYLVMLLLLDNLQVGMVDPANIQRLLMAKSQRQLRDQFFVLSVLSPAVQLTSMLLALTGVVLYPTLEGAQVVPQIIKDLLPTGTKGLAMAGLFEVSMGNIGSYLHAASITLVHDIIKPICDRVSLVINELQCTKYATMFVSVFSIAIGFTKTDDLYNLLFVSYECTPILVFPLWSGILGLKPDKHAFYFAAGGTTVVLFLSKFLLSEAQSHFVIFFSLAANGMIFLASMPYAIMALKSSSLILPVARNICGSRDVKPS